MTADGSQLEYEARVNRALEYVQRHLDRELGLEVLAAQACFSPWHFHRIFSALVGETPDAHVRRLRLERAASLLSRRPPESVTEVAMRCGFSTPSHFSRNFKAHFGLSPRQWQIERPQARAAAESAAAAASKNRQAEGGIRTAPGGDGQALAPPGGYVVIGKETSAGPHAAIEVEVRRLQPIKLAYVWHLKGYFKGVAESFLRIQGWMRARELLGPDSRCIGVNFDNPDVTPAERCRMLAGVNLPPDCDLESLKPVGRLPVGFTTLAGGLYGVWRYRGDGRDLRQDYYQFYGHWLPQSGLAPRDEAGFMLSGARTRLEPGLCAIDCEVHIPLAPL